ncbi:type I glutamate--ammonia ligase [Marinivivus vitaminiproducens]|uniref:type I glutamate--ammonia ligase n=1 Tax=Marinivivus vitaminiproducens TaxID=3035935 RepID=UPI0027A6B1F1|nr:type I glutamate--ammonia ligase [Geminicoccaceae bacterium SCSIO 64248]
MTDLSGIVERIEAEGVRFVDLRFTDLSGVWQHVGMNASMCTAERLQDGFMIDGSGIDGWRPADESDLVLRPDPATAALDPFSAQPTLILVCDVGDPAGDVAYDRCPRGVARRALGHLAETGAADRALIGTEVEFFVFDDVRFASRPHESFVHLDGEALPHNSGTVYQQGNGGHRSFRPRHLPLPPADPMADLRAEMATILEQLGFRGLHHNQGRSAGQNEIGSRELDLVQAADALQMQKYVVHNVAASYGKSATFMPMPLAAPFGVSSLHVHQSLRLGERFVFAGHDYANLSETCLHYIGGILHHAHALSAFTNPTTNSYRRLCGGAEVPRWLTYSAQNRSAAVRIPHAARNEDKRAEIRFADPTANPYLAFAAMLMAGLDGIRRHLDPGEAMDRNLYDLPPESLTDLETLAPSLEAALTALAADRDFLTEGDVFSAELIEAYIGLKRQDIARIAATPHPLEFEMYYGS